MNISGGKRGPERRLRRRLAVAAVAMGVLAGLAMPTVTNGDAPGTTGSPEHGIRA